MSYEAIFVSVTSEENSKPFDLSNLRLIGLERILNGTFEILEDLDDEHFQISVEIYTNPARDGNYKLLPMSVYILQKIWFLFQGLHQKWN